MQCNEVRHCGGKQQLCGQSHERPVQPSLVWQGWVWVSGFLGVGQSTQRWLQAVHTILGYQVWDCSLWGEQGLPMPGASFRSCRGSNTIAASPVSSLPLLLLVFLGAERWECAQLEGWQPALLSFLLSLSHPPTPLLQHPARGQGWGWVSHPADVQGGGVSWRLPQAPRVPWCCLVEREGGCGPGSWRSC